MNLPLENSSNPPKPNLFDQVVNYVTKGEQIGGKPVGPNASSLLKKEAMSLFIAAPIKGENLSLGAKVLNGVFLAGACTIASPSLLSYAITMKLFKSLAKAEIKELQAEKGKLEKDFGNTYDNILRSKEQIIFQQDKITTALKLANLNLESGENLNTLAGVNKFSERVSKLDQSPSKTEMESAITILKVSIAEKDTAQKRNENILNGGAIDSKPLKAGLKEIQSKLGIDLEASDVAQYKIKVEAIQKRKNELIADFSTNRGATEQDKRVYEARIASHDAEYESLTQEISENLEGALGLEIVLGSPEKVKALENEKGENFNLETKIGRYGLEIDRAKYSQPRTTTYSLSQLEAMEAAAKNALAEVNKIKEKFNSQAAAISSDENAEVENVSDEERSTSYSFEKNNIPDNILLQDPSSPSPEEGGESQNKLGQT